MGRLPRRRPPRRGIHRRRQLFVVEQTRAAQGRVLTMSEHERQRRCTEDDVARALLALDKLPHRVAAAAWPADLEGLDEAGLYSWWVDESGASDLSSGLAQGVGAGRIYAGQTGATKWPSG